MTEPKPVSPGRTVLLLVLLGTTAGLPACSRDSSSPGGAERRDAIVRPDTDVVAMTFGERRNRRALGRKLYMAECSGCHGERGNGDGPAADAIDPKPRDLVTERFKFRRTAFTDPPIRADIVDTIALGMPGSAMPPFDFLPAEEQELIAEYVLYLAGIDLEDPAPVVELPPETPARADSLARGRAVYEKLECFMCHGDEGHGDGPSSETLVDERGRRIEARDFRLGLFRRGRTAAELYRTFETGIAGTAMPSYADLYTPEEAWDLARYVLSLTEPPPPLSADPLERGRQVVQKHNCQACHVIEGRGGLVGPNLDVSAQKLLFPWIQDFLADPREFGKIYPFTPYRMPDLGLQLDEIEGVVTLLAHLSGREFPEPAQEIPAISADEAGAGTLLYVIKCAECHNLGDVIGTPLAKQQGPDLIHVVKRLRYDWITDWVANPQRVYPGTSMIDTNLTDEEIERVRGFLWHTSGGAVGQ